MGEVNVVSLLIDELKKLDKTLGLYVTVMTESGYNRARELFGKENVGYLPLDYRTPIRRFVKKVKPRKAIFIETEIWPNLIMYLRRRDIGVYLANGRLTERSFGNYWRFKNLFGRLLNGYNQIMVQTDEDRRRFIDLGVVKDKIRTIGNLKLDAPGYKLSEANKNQIQACLPFSEDRRLFVAGSIRNDELSIIIDTFAKFRQQNDTVSMILVPRYLDRIAEIIIEIENAGLSCCRYTDPGGNKDNPDIFVVDAMGLLAGLYSFGEIAFVGGTLDNIGGHNILEPVWAGIPVLYGPSIENVKESAAYVESNNFGAMVADETELLKGLIRFFKGELTFAHRTDEGTTDRIEETVRIILGQK
jgi:3-deoxy-D-manno-octulosonic-acid transferase